jgi:hypothetical protein
MSQKITSFKRTVQILFQAFSPLAHSKWMVKILCIILLILPVPNTRQPCRCSRARDWRARLPLAVTCVVPLLHAATAIPRPVTPCRHRLALEIKTSAERLCHHSSPPYVHRCCCAAHRRIVPSHPPSSGLASVPSPPGPLRHALDTRRWLFSGCKEPSNIRRRPVEIIRLASVLHRCPTPAPSSAAFPTQRTFYHRRHSPPSLNLDDALERHAAIGDADKDRVLGVGCCRGREPVGPSPAVAGVDAARRGSWQRHLRESRIGE